ncbi:MAG TPA: molybdopterin cofactor-binding domain-containing protein [Kofleriaceae bacterium]|nr:molybdopterin cofactor-binding domain-containing protein [Kofleriaceae bacterium]
MSAPIKVTRRAFLVGLGLTTGGLALGVRHAWAAEPSGKTVPAAQPAPQGKAGLDPHALVHIDLDGSTTILCHRSEMGQGVRSTIPLLIADELGADASRITVRQAEGDKKYGDQETDGSSSIRGQYEDLRKAGAAARMMLCTAAAKKWGVKPETCTTKNHEVIHEKSKRKLPFAALVADAAKLPVPKPKDITLRPASELVRTTDPNLPLLDGQAIITGNTVYGADVRFPDMLIAVIERPPAIGDKVAKYDAKRALAIPGVKHVIEMPAPKVPYNFQPWGGIAVVADTTWAALKGRAALDITWEPGSHSKVTWESYRNDLLASARAGGKPARNVGDIDAAFGKAAKVVEAEYVVPHLAHMTMEPLAAIVRPVQGRTVEVWAPTQDPQGAREEVAKLFGLDETAVTINVTLLGGGFGRKSKSDFIAEAAHLAKQLGVPVRVQWTREDDIRHGYYNAANAQVLRAALDDKNNITAWHHRTALTPITTTFKEGADTPTPDNLQQGVLDLALAIPNVRAEPCKGTPHVRVGWYRSVYNIFHAFAVGSFIDELAHARGKDPRDTWLDVIGPAKKFSLADLGVAKLSNYGEPLDKHPVDSGRLRNVIERVTDAAKWSDRKGRFLGLAAHRSFVTYTAVVISVVPDPTRVFRIDEAWIAMDPGTVYNRERVHAQMEGSIVMGVSNALYGGITQTNGATDQSNFRDARIARIRDIPKTIHTDLIASTEPPSGVGEPGVPPVGPALANAVFALTGKRIREIPLARTLGVPKPEARNSGRT